VIEDEERGSIHVLRIRRADKANALTEQLKTELAGAVEERSRDTRTHALVTTGEGAYFSSGSDVVEMSHFSPQEMQRMLTAETRLYRSLLHSPKPVVAAVNGFAQGGGVALVACSDWVGASEEALFGMPELGVGVAVSLEGALLPWIVGLGHARRLWYDPSARMDGAEALRVGLVQELAAAKDPEKAACERATALARLPAGAFALQKPLILTLLLTGAGETVVEVSRHGTPLLFASPETRRALERFW
jgi:enoyl-CoA hydratase/carnithine racemase